MSSHYYNIMRDSFSQKPSFPNRISSAPPDEGEPHLKTPIILNLFAAEFQPSQLISKPIVPIHAEVPPKKQLRADASVYEPIKSLSADTPSFELNDNAKSFVPLNLVPQTLLNPLPIISESVTPIEPILKAEIENKSKSETLQEKSLVEVETFNEEVLEESKKIEKKKYSLNEIKGFKFDFVKDPNFLNVPNEILQIKERKVEIIKINRNKKGDDKKIMREVQIISCVQWRKARTAEEEKISKKAKEYLQRFSVTPGEQEVIKKQVRITLNKLSPNNLEKLSKDILETCKKSNDYLKLVVSGIFEKAWAEMKYTQMYSGLCRFLKDSFEGFSYVKQEETPTKNLFKYELLYMCEETFTSNPAENDFTGLSEEEHKAKLEKIKKKILGNVRFIGELFNVNLITAKIILDCVNCLIDSFERENNEDKLEGACVLLLTGGPSFERSKLKISTDEIYQRLENIEKNASISSKNKFKLIDLQEFRAAGWKNMQKKELKTVEEIHAEHQSEQKEILKRHGYNN